ncbi:MULTISPECIES: hypothetical protein [unclassified Okeania]|uniref:hypothetical protein n=1 Tax=unclassified Okeania TaxID=2634635 RepID=UPI0013B7AD14|nr:MULTISPECIES: hypothetical protein [unclassified Okeania]NET19241.1 hypothetical protein [Okeania sp. SIO1H5]NET93487.1 hypothetical protein [Okeania sp. SIO1H2]
MLKKSFSRSRRQEKTHPSPLPRPWRGRQETGGMGNERGGRSGRFVPRLFCPNLDQNHKFLNHYHLKPRTF